MVLFNLSLEYEHLKIKDGTASASSLTATYCSDGKYVIESIEQTAQTAMCLSISIVRMIRDFPNRNIYKFF